MTIAELDPVETPFVRPDRAAEILGVDRKTLLSALAADPPQIPSTRVGHRYLIPTAWLLRQAQLEND